jgi:hypothetical protein
MKINVGRSHLKNELLLYGTVFFNRIKDHTFIIGTNDDFCQLYAKRCPMMNTNGLYTVNAGMFCDVLSKKVRQRHEILPRVRENN